MSSVLISTKGQIVLPVAVRKALGLTPGMRVYVKVNGKSAQITPAPVKKSVSLKEIQALLNYDGPAVGVSAMRVTDYKGWAVRAIDTNVLVRAVVNDNAAQSARAVALLTGHDIFIPVTVVLELEWVLRSRYAFAPKVVAQAIEKIAALGNVVVGERAAVLAAAASAAQGWEFAGPLHHALSHGCEDFSTLDADLVKRAARATASGAKVMPVITKL